MAAAPFRHPKTAPSISTYGGIFIACVILLMGGIVGFTLYQIGQTQHDIQQNHQAVAREELRQALLRLQTDLEHNAEALANWDEAKQNLSDPAYYRYWRESRALSAGVVSDPVHSLALFDKAGAPLSREAADELPPASPTRTPQLLATGKNRRIDVYYLFPVWGDRNRQELLGYASLGVNLREILQNRYPLQYVQVPSLHLIAKDNENVPYQALPDRLSYTIQDSAELASMEHIMRRSLLQIVTMVAILSAIFYIALVSLLVRPLRRLSQHIDALRAGHDTLLTESYRGALPVGELEKIRDSLNDYQLQLDNMHLNLESKSQELWSMAYHDALTGVHNRRAFEEDWECALGIATTRGTDLAFILFDCDHFKAINDTYGHPTGDLVIRGIAEALQKTLRSDDRLYRIGGDEFAMLLLGATPAQALKTAQRCMEEVTAHDFSSTGIKEPIRISIGLSHAHGKDADALRALHKQADIAMYYAKRPDHHKIVQFDASMTNAFSGLVSNWVANAVYEALKGTRPLEMHYQPIVHLATGQITYYEALVRIREGNELIMPGSIFHIVESKRLDAEFDLAVIEQVKRDLQDGLLPHGTGVAINLSGPTIILDGILEKLRTLAPWLPHYKIVLEITETTLITQIERASSHLSALRAAGFSIALDDFGSGYSSLMYLSNMPVDLIKFDISLIRSLHDGGERQRNVVENMARLLSNAGYQLLAEGVENESYLNKISGLGFTHAQGYFFGRPERMPAAQTAQRRSSL